MPEEQEQAQQPAAAEQTEAGGSLLDQILDETTVKREHTEAYEQLSTGMKAFLAEILPRKEAVKPNKAAIDQMIAMLDKKLSSQIDEILHHPDFQKLESAWRGLRFVVERTDFRQNIKIRVLSVSKSDLAEDFDLEMDIAKTGLYKKVFTEEIGQLGGEPYGTIIANYDFGPGAQDMALLQKCASVATMAHAPFIAASDKKFFGTDDLTSMPNLKDIKSILEGPQYMKWQAFRETDDSRWVGLTCPRFLLRLPYGENTNAVKSFNYEERVDQRHEDYLWGNTAFALASRLTAAFAKSRWCPNIIGPESGGTVEDLHLHQFESMGEMKTTIPTEVLVSERREFELSEEGFIPLVYRKNSDNAVFFSANSCQKPKTFGQSKEGKEAEANYRLSTRLPYLFVVSRLSHYLKVIQREHLGSGTDRVQLQKELDNWIRQYVTDNDNPSPSVRARRPLRGAQIKVEDVEGQPGWFKVDMKVMPHIQYEGVFVTLSLVGKMGSD